MSRIHVEATATIHAEPEVVYNIIADYRDGHPRIMPEEYFSDLRVEEGGQGEGTVISFNIKVGGSKTAYRKRIEEPQPGRVLVERDLNSDMSTTFTVSPTASGQSLVKIETDWTGSRGLRGIVERVAAPGMLRKVYDAELRNLDEVATSYERQGQES